MRDIKYIVVHCTATLQNATVTAIQNYWKNILKWKSPGYHKIVDKDGREVTLASDDRITNGVAGYNKNSLHVSYIGGVDKNKKPLDNRTDAQKETMLRIINNWKKKYPKAIIQGHSDFPKVNKACPCFNAKEEYKNVK